jgi:hypothetical protein
MVLASAVGRGPAVACSDPPTSVERDGTEITRLRERYSRTRAMTPIGFEWHEAGTALLAIDRGCRRRGRSHRRTVHHRPAPGDAGWNAERRAVEFGVEISEYPGVGRLPRHRLAPTVKASGALAAIGVSVLHPISHTAV